MLAAGGVGWRRTTAAIAVLLAPVEQLHGAPGEDGVVRYTPSPVEPVTSRPGDDDDDVAGWFQTDPAGAVPAAGAETSAGTETSTTCGPRPCTT